MTERLRIEPLADHPELFPILAEWENAEWGHLMPDVSIEDLAAAFARRANRDRVPMTFVGLLDEEFVSTASLVERDLPPRADLSPWLAIVRTLPQQRGRGFGSALVRAVMDKAFHLGHDRLYLYTPDQQDFYARLGFRPLETMAYRGETITIMRADQAHETRL